MWQRPGLLLCFSVEMGWGRSAERPRGSSNPPSFVCMAARQPEGSRVGASQAEIRAH